MRFNRKALEMPVLFCLLVAASTWKSVSGSWAHAAEATAAVLILLIFVWFMRHGQRQRTRGSSLPTSGRS